MSTRIYSVVCLLLKVCLLIVKYGQSIASVTPAHVNSFEIGQDESIPASRYDEEEYTENYLEPAPRTRNKNRSWNKSGKFYYFMQDPRRYSWANSEYYQDQVPAKSDCNYWTVSKHQLITILFL